ncbi:SGNH/GDSL hydrolase family protein [Labrenzia sp. 011]|uniref:SGNH/GDSL hydrolase family protein n=1 Tax=Labrenzia sp. 011 TaxID=2171494 RepID=UPI000D513898|nr:SGNH/GDSL hydrolase family protein [Labrenzia sp. 011]PVB62088.1 GDSL family lipase [Labrenzia sp. 011]
MPEGKDPVSVVCFGDSLTWGFNPADRSRYGHDIRWTRRMQRDLGPGFYVLEEGVNGRTTVHEDPVMGDRNGLAHLGTVRRTHMPIDILIIMLGTNDLKTRFSGNAETIATSMGRLLDFARRPTDDVEGRAPKVLLMSPPPLGPLAGTPFAAQFDDRSYRESYRLAACYRDKAAEYGAAFFDTGTVIAASRLDAVHFDAEPQADLAKAVAAEVRKLAES